MRWTLLTVTAVLAVGVVTAGCSEFDDKRGWGDAPARQVEDREVLVWPAPDQFMNVGAYCIGEDAVYVHTRAAAPVVVGDSPNCDPNGVLYEADPITSTRVEGPPEEGG